MDVDVADGVARLVDGDSLAGEHAHDGRRFAQRDRVRPADRRGRRAASSNPARVIGLADEIGSIEPGKRANLLVLDEALSLVAVIEDGAVVAGGHCDGAVIVCVSLNPALDVTDLDSMVHVTVHDPRRRAS